MQGYEGATRAAAAPLTRVGRLLIISGRAESQCPHLVFLLRPVFLPSPSPPSSSMVVTPIPLLHTAPDFIVAASPSSSYHRHLSIPPRSSLHHLSFLSSVGSASSHGSSCDSASYTTTSNASNSTDYNSMSTLSSEKKIGGRCRRWGWAGRRGERAIRGWGVGSGRGVILLVSGLGRVRGE
jgi:hypothetical protein